MDIANVEQYELWNGDSGRRWVADPDRRDVVLADAGAALMAAAGLRAGERVLDVGCGCGPMALTAARAVAPDGDVVGLDLSAPMLEVARRRAASAGVANVTFEQADVQVHPIGDGSFDVAISRFGTMFFADAVAAFANIRRALRPGGRLCIVTWQPPAANQWLTLPASVLMPDGSIDDLPRGPGMFAQSDRDAVTGVLEAAGYVAITVTPATIAVTLGDTAADAVDYLGETTPGRTMLEAIPEGGRAGAVDALRRMFAEHMTPQGVQLDAGILVTSASASGDTAVLLASKAL
jgi:ubiquinone/menaquinone biosynthesis C-methylase UbiE